MTTLLKRDSFFSSSYSASFGCRVRLKKNELSLSLSFSFLLLARARVCARACPGEEEEEEEEDFMCVRINRDEVRIAFEKRED